MQKIELDIFIPNYGLAFEYQGKQHFKEYDGVPVDERRARDEMKRELCKENGITLIEVPYWWNGTKSALAAMILKV